MVIVIAFDFKKQKQRQKQILLTRLGQQKKGVHRYTLPLVCIRKYTNLNIIIKNDFDRFRPLLTVSTLKNDLERS